MPPKGKYTDPKLRDEVKEEIHNSDKGGAPGQWSARKAQMMASEYKKRGGGYTTDKETGQDESQAHLSKWTEEEWQTKEGSGNAKKADGTQKRYLPKKAWEQMDEEEKEETEDKKQAGSKQGKQHVGNTDVAKDARKDANAQEDKQFDEKKANQKKKREEKSAAEEKDSKEENNEDEKPQGRQTRSSNRKRAAPATEDKETQSNKKQKSEASTSKAKSAQGRKSETSASKTKGAQEKKTVGSKHDSTEEPAPQGSASRLPKVGQKASWKALPGWVHGKVTEIVTSNKTVHGKSVKASKDDPRIALEADSGKGCVHKPDACYYE